LKIALGIGAIALAFDLGDRLQAGKAMPLGHIAGALNIPLAGLAARTAELARARCPIVLVCLTDKRSAQAAAELAGAGIRHVAVLRGGMRGWRGGG